MCDMERSKLRFLQMKGRKKLAWHRFSEDRKLLEEHTDIEMEHKSEL